MRGKLDVANHSKRMPVLSQLALIVFFTFSENVSVAQPLTQISPAVGTSHVSAARLSLLQMKHSSWTSRDGAPSLVLNIGETKEGFLWLASREGLFRFDGLSFEAMDVGVDREKYGLPRRIAVARDGRVWIWYPKGWLAVYRAGHLRFIKAPEMGGEVFHIVETRDGAIWLAVAQIGQPIRRYQKGRWDTVMPNPSRDMLVDIIEAGDGAVWLSYNEALLRRALGADQFERIDVPHVRGAKLAADAGGNIWLTAPTGGRRITGPRGKWPAKTSRWFPWDADGRFFGVQFDRNGDLWVLGRGFGRVAGLAQAERAGTNSVVFELGNIPQMSSNRPASMLVDQIGQIWFGGPRSLDRFSVPSVVPEPELTDVASYGDTLFTSSSGSVYLGQNAAVYKVEPGERPVRILATGSEVEAICEDKEGAIWIVLGDRIIQLRGEQRTNFPRPFAETGVYGCGADETGRFWLLASTSGLYWLDGVEWRSIRPDASKTFDPYAMARDAQDRLWVLTEPEVLTRLAGGFAERRAIGPTASLGKIVSLLPTSRGFLMSGEDGAALTTPTGVTRMAPKQTMALRGVTGLTETPQGDTWAFGRGLVRFRTSDFRRALKDPNFIIPERAFTFEDGLPNGANAQAIRSMTVGGDGRIWLATIDGPVWIDPAKVFSNPVPPGVAITSLSSGGRVFRDPVQVDLLAGASDIAIAFSALSRSTPDRVKVLYRLEGHDKDWVDPGRRRQAFYTNLEPGDYRFRVIAANEDNVWNRLGGTVTVSIPPTFLQSWAFKVLCGLVILVLGWIGYSIRVRTVAKRIRMRMADRIGERERIAREIHDTLLQSVQSVTLRFHLAVDEMSATEPIKPSLSEAIDQADRVIAEGRDRVRNLRPLSRAATFEAELHDIIERQAFDSSVNIGLHVSGHSRPLDPLAFDELTQIASEAIFNIWRHSEARQIDVQISYGTPFCLQFIDNGVGIDRAVADAGQRPGHFGIPGMRERTEKLNGKFSIGRRLTGGTELIIAVPGTIAYEKQDARTKLFSLINLIVRYFRFNLI
ncbi:sensor histidine kinase [Novosphingobium kaempferiae]|uniref:sensor histidine kinase n=1 Tax=Novosphingobium kaempferiae TaxID=2896849 RepID=UPI001E2B03A4|nr:sensor histidine kinase [Novosphingobium kaempferiae]